MIRHEEEEVADEVAPETVLDPVSVGVVLAVLFFGYFLAALLIVWLMAPPAAPPPAANKYALRALHLRLYRVAR